MTESETVLGIMQEALSPQFAASNRERIAGEPRGDAEGHGWVSGVPSEFHGPCWDIARFYVRLEAISILIHAINYLLSYGIQMTQVQFDAVNELLDVIDRVRR